MRNWFNDFKNLTTEQEKQEFIQEVEKNSFTAINEITRSFHEELKKIDENGFEDMNDWIELGKKLFPDLLRFSPTWEYFWADMTKTYQNKVDYYQEIPNNERDGVWEVLYDNPFSLDGIVCHPDKSFEEATYLAAKYQVNLKKAELIKLQKISHSFMKRGK